MSEDRSVISQCVDCGGLAAAFKNAPRVVHEGRHTLIHGDALEVVGGLKFDAIITDPPYSSGGFTRGDRQQGVAAKYQQSGQALKWSGFTGDNRDQRSWVAWVALWLARCAQVMTPGGYVMVFSDWRQLPALTDALQAGGFQWRGVIAWDKGAGARAPHTGYFRHQCEFIAWGSLGPMGAASHGGPWPGAIAEPVLQAEKMHMTGKPIRVMEQLVQAVRPGAVVLDPFMGSGSTGVACERLGRRFIGVELDAHYFEVARSRVAAAVAQGGLFDGREGESAAGTAPDHGTQPLDL